MSDIERGTLPPNVKSGQATALSDNRRRERIATAVLAALCSRSDIPIQVLGNERCGAWAVAWADALMAELDRK